MQEGWPSGQPLFCTIFGGTIADNHIKKERRVSGLTGTRLIT
jgi:hypothetical protein